MQQAFTQYSRMWVAPLVACAILLVIFTPYSLKLTVFELGLRFPALYGVMAPSLASLSPGYAPGVDYAAPLPALSWLLHFLLSSDLVETLERYAQTSLLLGWAFCCSYLVMLRKLGVSNAGALLGAAMVGLSSLWDLRLLSETHMLGWLQLFLPCALIALGYAVAQRRAGVVLLCAVCCALVMLYHSVSGVLLVITACAVWTLAKPFSARTCAIWLVALVISYLVFAIAMFGLGVLQPAYLPLLMESFWLERSLLQPPLEGWENALRAGLLTLGCAAFAFSYYQQRKQPRTDRVMVMATSLLLLLLTGAYWPMNSELLMAIAAPWALALLLYAIVLLKKRLLPSTMRTRTGALAFTASMGMAVAALLLASVQPGFRFTPVTASLSGSVPDMEARDCADMACLKSPLVSKDLMLIRNRVKEGERVFLYSSNDWMYLLQAYRAPALVALPAKELSSPRQIEQSLNHLQDVQYVFTAKGGNDDLGISNPFLADKLVPLLRRQFRIDGIGEHLIAWKRDRRPSAYSPRLLPEEESKD